MHNKPFTPSDVSQRRDKRWHGQSVSHEAFVGFPCIYRAHRPYWRGKHLEPAAGDLGLCQSGRLLACDLGYVTQTCLVSVP